MEQTMKSNAFSLARDFAARWEGGISDHPADRGGVTAYGASIKFVSDIANSPDGREFLTKIGIKLPISRKSILSLAKYQVDAMFKREFWDKLNLDALHESYAMFLYDSAVNHGPAQAVKFAQRGYNDLVNYGVKLDVDGILGTATRRALAIVSPAIVKACVNARRRFYQQIVANDRSQSVFLNGWMNRANALEKIILARLAE